MAHDIKAQLRDKQDRLQSRWSLFLAVGNGGFLTAIGSKVLDALYGKEHLHDIHDMLKLCLPMMILFTFGLIFSATIPVVELIRTRRILRLTSGMAEAADKYWDNIWNWAPEILAGVFFLAGVVFGIWQLSRM